jgi:hypothetical protein
MTLELQKDPAVEALEVPLRQACTLATRLLAA